jgi:hypothetical protein
MSNIDPTQVLRADENLDYLERCFENGDLLSSRQYQILYENCLKKLERIAKRNDLSFDKLQVV